VVIILVFYFIFKPSSSTYMGTAPHVTTTDLKLIKLVCIKDTENFINRPVSSPLCSTIFMIFLSEHTRPDG